MDFIDKIQELIVKIPKQLDYTSTEEATKNALVMPFIVALGYNVFDPTEVIPEFVADVGIKKGEKVDYAIMRDGKPIILIECKTSGTSLDNVHASQLFRYFSVTDSRVGVLTNGIIYKFYSDLEKTNKMDSKPFLEINLLNLNESQIVELKNFTKSKFNIDEVISSAGDLKYTKEIKKILNDQLIDPNDEFVRYFASKVYSGKLRQVVREQFTGIVKKAFSQFISDKINDRLKSAMDQESAPSDEIEKDEELDLNDRKNRIETTEEELEGFYIIKSILREFIDPSRIICRDTISYFGILLDDNNRKPICRLYFNNSDRKCIAFIDENKKENKIVINDLNEIYKYAARLKATVEIYKD